MSKTRSFLLLTGAVLLAATVVLAQGGGRGNAPTPGPGAGTPAVDPATVVTLEGPVVSFTGGAGTGMPTLTVDDAVLGETAVRLGPYWFLADAGFTAAEGGLVEVEAFICPQCNAEYVAIRVENLTSGVVLTLRDEEGVPLWIGSAAGGPGRGAGAPGAAFGPYHGLGPRHGFGLHHGFGPGPGLCGGGRVDPSAAITVTGFVISFTGGPGEGFPTLTLDAAGEELVVMVGPFWAWLAAGFLPEEGQELTVTYAPVTFGDQEHLVALAVTEMDSGLTVVLRDPETGKPGFGPGCCWNG